MPGIALKQPFHYHKTCLALQKINTLLSMYSCLDTVVAMDIRVLFHFVPCAVSK